ncbi:MAG: class I SAM-dependent methyltransferase [Solirubrobacterales bacterium]
MSCRFCSAEVTEVLDLGATPPANSLLTERNPDQPRFPLVLEWCETCDNVQLRDCLSADDLYSDYLYVTPTSSMLSVHYDKLMGFMSAGGYVNPESNVMEIGSNAGLFLAHIKDQVGSIVGIDPAEAIAQTAIDIGVPTVVDFFNAESAQRAAAEYGTPDLVIGRHCMAHNEWPQEMVRGAAAVLEDGGHLVIENAYLLNTLENAEFDQIYHEHMYYFSIRSLESMLAKEGFTVVDATVSLIHGGSIIVVARKGEGEPTDSIAGYWSREGLFLNGGTFERFRQRAQENRDHLITLVGDLTDKGHSVYTYGATAKGNTQLNFAGLTYEQIPYCVDNTEVKRGKFLPGSGIEVIDEQTALADPPDFFLLTAWNYKDEIISKVRDHGNYKSKFIVPIPFVHVV